MLFWELSKMRRRGLQGAPSKPDSPAKGRYGPFLAILIVRQAISAAVVTQNNQVNFAHALFGKSAGG